MSTLSPDRWKELSSYLDQALTLTERERVSWFDALRAQKPELARQVEELLKEHQEVQREAFLEGNAVASSQEPELTGQTVGAYRLVAALGQGGMGTVWLAERSDGRFERKAAVKFLSAALIGHGGEALFKREGAILGRLAHPNIAELLDAGVSPLGQPYLVIEYVEGESIDQYCDARKLDVRRRIRLFLDVLGAVAHAHANLIIHRDIKPSNVLISKDGSVKLLDFGIAKLLEGGGQQTTASLVTHQTAPAFTPLFAAPEQLTNGVVTTATDVYELSVLLYVLLTGQHPCGSGVHSPADLVRLIVELDAPPASSVITAERGKIAAQNRGTTPEKLKRQLQGDLDAIVRKGLQKQPQQRYITAEALAEDLRRYLASEPVIAQPESTWYSARKFLSRRRWAVASVASVVLALAAGLSAALWQSHIARNESKVAVAMERFLEEIFQANSSYQDDPLKARQTTARELLDIGARNIDEELTDVPEAKLRTMKTLANMYVQLGLDDEAVKLQRKRVALAKSTFGPQSKQAAYALVDFGASLHASHSVAEEEVALLEANKIFDQLGDFTSTDRANLLLMLGQHYQGSDLKKALEYATQSVAVYRKYPSDPLLSEALYGAAFVNSRLGRAREAEPMLTEAIQVSAKLNGDPNASMARFYATLAEAQDSLAEFAPAEQSFRHAVQIARKLNGENHIDTMETELRLASFLANTSRGAEALQHLETARQILIRTRSDDDPFYAPQVYLEYGRALAGMGRLEDGLAYITKAVDNRRKNRPGTAYLAQMLQHQAGLFVDFGRYDDAQRTLDEASAIAKKVNYPVQYPEVDARARLLIATGHAKDADQPLSAYHPPASAEGALPLAAIRLQMSRSEVALAAGDSESAERLAADIRQQLRASPIRDYLKVVEARVSLVEGRALLLRGQSSQALPLLQRSVELRQAVLDSASPALARAQIALAECYLDLGNEEQATALSSLAQKSLSSHKRLGSLYMQPLNDLEQRIHRASSSPRAR